MLFSVAGRKELMSSGIIFPWSGPSGTRILEFPEEHSPDLQKNRLHVRDSRLQEVPREERFNLDAITSTVTMGCQRPRSVPVRMTSTQDISGQGPSGPSVAEKYLSIVVPGTSKKEKEEGAGTHLEKTPSKASTSSKDEDWSS